MLLEGVGPFHAKHGLAAASDLPYMRGVLLPASFVSQLPDQRKRAGTQAAQASAENEARAFSLAWKPSFLSLVTPLSSTIFFRRLDSAAT